MSNALKAVTRETRRLTRAKSHAFKERGGKNKVRTLERKVSSFKKGVVA